MSLLRMFVQEDELNGLCTRNFRPFTTTSQVWSPRGVVTKSVDCAQGMQLRNPGQMTVQSPSMPQQHGMSTLNHGQGVTQPGMSQQGAAQGGLQPQMGVQQQNGQTLVAGQMAYSQSPTQQGQVIFSLQQYSPLELLFFQITAETRRLSFANFICLFPT